MYGVCLRVCMVCVCVCVRMVCVYVCVCVCVCVMGHLERISALSVSLEPIHTPGLQAAEDSVNGGVC